MKRLYLFVSFVFLLFLSPFLVDAKSFDSEFIDVSFGKEDSLNLSYTGYNKFTVEKDKTFYYNGVLHTLSNSDMNAGYVIIDGDRLNYLDWTLTSSTNHEFYMFGLELTISGTKTYVYTQELCYKYGSVERCSIDSGDTTDISAGSFANNFFYSFIPFYDEGLEFDYLYYNLTFTNKSDSSDIVKVERLGFFTDEGDTIKYDDYFDVKMINFDSMNYENDDKYYITPLCLNESSDSFYECEDELYLSVAVNNANSSLTNARNYKFTFEISVGQNYENTYTIDNDNISVLMTGYSYWGYYYYYLEDYQDKVSHVGGTTLYIPISNIIEYNKADYLLSYESFKFTAKYVCYENCSDSRAINTAVETSKIYYLDLDSPSIVPTPVEGVQLPNYSTVANNGSVIVKVNIFDFNGVSDLGYFISNKSNVSDYESQTYIPTSNGSNIEISGIDGFYYIHYRIKENSTGKYVYRYHEILIDTKAPILTGNNFSDYLENASYSSVSLNITFRDETLEIPYTSIISKAYYKIVMESELNDLTVNDVVNSNEYSNGVTISKSNISSDGIYVVCFVLKDYLGNYSELKCSDNYYIDITALDKNEVSATSVSGYQKEVRTTITIAGISNGVSFRCGLSKVEITSENELTNTCYNNKETKLTINDEAIYNLWIYASDYAGNYSLIKLDNSYYVDSLAPRISVNVTGDKSSYSNDVKIDVIASDLNDIDETNLKYGFYLATYNEATFESFTLEDGISYPYDYYGSYKLAIKVCDVIGNCKINTSGDTYLIDTAKISLEIIGDSKISILQFQKYSELGVKATKGNAGKTKVEVDYVISGSVDTNTPGVYKIVYSAGEGMNKVSIEREVTVIKSDIYIGLIIGAFVIGEAIILMRLFIKKRKNANI